MSVEETRQYLPDPGTVGAARRFVWDALNAVDQGVAEDGALLVSEVASNVVEHARTEYEVRVVREGGWARVEVLDGSSIIPAVQELAADAERGRGLRLLERLAVAWGVDERPGGKCVWFELGSPRPTA